MAVLEPAPYSWILMELRRMRVTGHSLALARGGGEGLDYSPRGAEDHSAWCDFRGDGCEAQLRTG